MRQSRHYGCAETSLNCKSKKAALCTLLSLLPEEQSHTLRGPPASSRCGLREKRLPDKRLPEKLVVAQYVAHSEHRARRLSNQVVRNAGVEAAVEFLSRGQA